MSSPTRRYTPAAAGAVVVAATENVVLYAKRIQRVCVSVQHSSSTMVSIVRYCILSLD